MEESNFYKNTEPWFKSHENLETKQSHSAIQQGDLQIRPKRLSLLISLVPASVIREAFVFHLFVYVW